MDCCHAYGCDELFDEEQARRDAEAYRADGLDELGRRIVEEVGTTRSVLEIGGGVGALQIELLRAGAERVISVELSPAYEAVAHALLAEAGVRDRVDRRLGDFVRDPGLAADADAVVLHRVVCCYPDADALVRAAGAKARRVLVLTYPHEGWRMRLEIGVENLSHRLRRRTFRAYVHERARLERAARAAGLVPEREDGDARWRIGTFVRPASPVASVS